MRVANNNYITTRFEGRKIAFLKDRTESRLVMIGISSA